MSLVNYRKMFLPILTVIVIFVLWFGIIEFFDSANYISNYFYNPIFVYVPLTILSLSAILFLIYKISQKRVLGVFTASCFVLSFIYCFAVYSFMYISINNVEHQEKHKKIQEIFIPSNLIFPQREFEKSDVITMLADELPYHAFGETFLYSDEQLYVAEDNTSVTIDVYYVENLNSTLLKKLSTNMQERYYYNQNVTEIKISSVDVIETAVDEWKYSYCCETVEASKSSGRKYKSYFAAIIENEGALILVSMDIWHNEQIESQMMMQKLIGDIQTLDIVQGDS